MNKCVLQLWEESSRDGVILQDGCSIHVSESERDSYLKGVYDSRTPKIPSSYERIVGTTVEAFVSDNLYSKLLDSKNLRLTEIEKNNLISLEEIIFKPNT